MRATLCSFWGVLGASLIDYRDTFGLTWFSYRQKAQEAFECKPFMHLLNNLEGEE